MKKCIKRITVAVLAMAIMLTACVIAPVSVSAANYVSPDWTASNVDAVTVTNGDLISGYDISAVNQGFARCNEPIDMLKGVSFKIDVKSGWYFVSFESSNAGTPGLNNGDHYKFRYLFRLREDGALVVTFFNGVTELETTVIENFDASAEHTYHMYAHPDAYRFWVDDTMVCGGAAALLSDPNMVAMATNGVYVTIGAEFDATFKDFRVKGHGWSIHNGYNDFEKEAVYVHAGGFAALNKQIDVTKGIKFKYTPAGGDWVCLSFNSTPVGSPNPMSEASFLIYAGDENGDGTYDVINIRPYMPGYPNNCTIAKISNFDFSVAHKFSFVMYEDGVYELHIDDQRCLYLPGGAGDHTRVNIWPGAIDAINNYGKGGYVTFGSMVNYSCFSEIEYAEPSENFVNVSYLNGIQSTINSFEVTANANGGYDLGAITTPTRCNKAVDMSKGVLFKLGYTGDWVGIRLDGAVAAMGGVESSGGNKLIFINRLYNDEQGNEIHSCSYFENNYEFNTAYASEHSGYYHLQYKQIDDAGNYGFYVNGKRYAPQHSINAEAWANTFNNGKMYITFIPNPSATIMDFKEYTETGIETNYAIADGMIKGIAANTTIDSLNIATKAGILRVYDGETVVTEGKVKTGMTICDFVNSGYQSEIYTIVVTGDMVGDGEINAQDLILLRKSIFLDVTGELSAAVQLAADMNNDANINILDLVKMKKIVSSVIIKDKIFSVADYGAVGDGVTDDTLAITATINAAKKYTATNNGMAAIVSFEEKEYAVTSQLQVSSCKNITLEGNNAIIVTPGISYMRLYDNRNVKVTELNFTYEYPVAYRAKAVRRITGTSITFEVPNWYVKCVEENEIANNSFAIPANDRRDISFYDSITKVDDTHVIVNFIDSGANGWSIIRTEEEMKTETYNICTQYVDLPTPGYSHKGNAFQILANSGAVELKDINIWNSSQFTFQVNNNSGNIRFNNVKLAPKDADSCPTVSWRDTVHAKDNRGALTFNNCSFKGTHDDIFNISNTMCRVDAVEQNTLTLYGLDYGGNFVAIKEGDTLVALNPITDKYYGEAKVTAVDRTNGIRVTIDRNIGIEKGAYVCFKELANPGTTINGGSFNGSFRIRASGTKITNADFSLLIMWTAFEGLNGPIEGPIPENITYNDCRFKSAVDDTSVGRMDFTCTLLDGTAAKSYAVSNILFDNCIFAYEKLVPSAVGVKVSNSTVAAW